MLSLLGKVPKLLITFVINNIRSNSTWIAEDTPCITYGLRGVVHCTVKITNKGPDLHSGIDGGAITEPMTDMFVSKLIMGLWRYLPLIGSNSWEHLQTKLIVLLCLVSVSHAYCLCVHKLLTQNR